MDTLTCYICFDMTYLLSLCHLSLTPDPPRNDCPALGQSGLPTPHVYRQGLGQPGPPIPHIHRRGPGKPRPCRSPAAAKRAGPGPGPGPGEGAQGPGPGPTVWAWTQDQDPGPGPRTRTLDPGPGPWAWARVWATQANTYHCLCTVLKACRLACVRHRAED